MSSGVGILENGHDVAPASIEAITKDTKGITLTNDNSTNDSVNEREDGSDCDGRGNRPLAGSTYQKYENPIEGKPSPENTWEHADSSVFNLRVGPNYERNKQKAPSPPAFMEHVGVDLVVSDTRIDDFASRVHFPAAWKERATGINGVPPIFVVNFQVPAEAVFTVFREITDGVGYSLVLYFRMTDDTFEQLANMSTKPLAPALSLFIKYLQEAPEADVDPKNPLPSPWRGRFKTMMHCRDIAQFNLPSFITSYNAKPILIRQTGTLYRGEYYVEMDINVHRFGSVPKQALNILKDRFHKMDIFMGFTIESREDNEMPETLFGCIALNRPIYHTAVKWRGDRDK